MSPDRFFLTQFLLFVVWMAVLLWAPGLAPTDKVPAGKRPVTIIVRPGTDSSAAPPSAVATPPAPPSGAAVVPVSPGS